MAWFIAWFLLVFCFGAIAAAVNSASAPLAEELWKSLEKLPAAEREKKLIEGATKAGEMVWNTN